MSDEAINVLKGMNGAEFLIVFVAILIGVMYLIPKVKYLKELMTNWYNRKKKQDEILNTILQNKEDIKELKKKDIEYHNALKELERNLSTAISSLESMICKLSDSNERQYIQTVRSELLDFCNASSVRNYKEDAYKHAIDLHAEYMDILQRRGEENGQIDESYKVMLENYQEHVRNGDFAHEQHDVSERGDDV